MLSFGVHTSNNGVNSALDVALGLSRVVLQQEMHKVKMRCARRCS